MSITAQGAQRSGNNSILWIRRGIWLYLWLLIFEGALRKWVVPNQLSGVFAIIRDPLVVVIYWLAFRSRKIDSPWFLPIVAIGLLMSLLAAAQIATGVASLPIVLFGLRSYILYLPLIFVMQKALTAEDVRKITRFFLIISIPMAILVIAQFRASPSSWLNSGALEGSLQLETALGHIRPAGTFSYGTGVAEFFPFVAAFVIAGLISAERRDKTLIWCAACATLVSIPFAGSRTLLFSLLLVAVASFVAASQRVKPLLRLTHLFIVIAVCGLIVSRLGLMRESLTAFETRWADAKSAEGSAGAGDILILRLLNPVLASIEECQRIPLIGEGIGVGSNFSSSLQNRNGEFLLAETEFLRLIQEAGPIVGPIFLVFRIILCLQLIYVSHRAAGRSVLPFLLAAATVPNLLFNVMEQPTNLGFMIFGAGLVFAAVSSTRRMPATSVLAKSRMPLIPAFRYVSN